MFDLTTKSPTLLIVLIVLGSIITVISVVALIVSAKHRSRSSLGISIVAIGIGLSIVFAGQGDLAAARVHDSILTREAAIRGYSQLVVIDELSYSLTVPGKNAADVAHSNLIVTVHANDADKQNDGTYPQEQYPCQTEDREFCSRLLIGQTIKIHFWKQQGSGPWRMRAAN